MYQHIGIVRLSALGDVILVVPTVRALQACYPEAKITWITTKACFSLLQGLSGVEFIVIDKPQSLGDYWRLKRQLASYHFDVLLAIQASLRANLLYPLIKASRKIGFDKARSKDLHRCFTNESIAAGKDHLLDGFMRFARKLGCELPTLRWDLPITSADYEFAKQTLPTGKVLVLNAAASKTERNWVIERYVSVLEEVKRWQVAIVLTGGPAAHEQQLAATIAAQLSFPVLNLVGKTTTKQLAAILAQASVLLAPDTGPVHLATAMGTPVVGLYAVAPPQLSGPYLSAHLVVNKYPEAITHILKQDPKRIPWDTRVHTQEAMKLITPAEVLQQLAKVLTPTTAL